FNSLLMIKGNTIANLKQSDIMKLSIWNIGFGNLDQVFGYSNNFQIAINADFPSVEKASSVILRSLNTLPAVA
ncbi:20146_t:CDS:1, partial [Racocetra fulgida]